MSGELTAQAAFDLFLSEAKAIDASNVRPFRVDPDLASANIQTAMQFFESVKAEIPKRMPGIDVSKLASLPTLVLATQFAVSEAERMAPSEKTVRQKLSQAAGLRRKVLSALEALAANEFIPHKEVEPILEGRGPMDMAKDCVSGVALLRKYEKEIGGRNPATAETMSEAEQVGSWLMANLRVGDAPAEKAGPPSVEVDVRNRMATLLALRYEELELVAHRFEGKNWQKVVPALGSRIRATKEEPPKG